MKTKFITFTVQDSHTSRKVERDAFFFHSLGTMCTPPIGFGIQNMTSLESSQKSPTVQVTVVNYYSVVT